MNICIGRYGIRVDPISWVNILYGQYHKEGEFPVFWMLGCKSEYENPNMTASIKI